MDLSLQVFLLCLCSLVADSHLFAYNGRAHPHSHRPHRGLLLDQLPPKHIKNNQPFTTAYVTTQKNKSPDSNTVVKTEAPTTPLNEDVSAEEGSNFLMNNVKVNGPFELYEDKNMPEVNTLSIPENLTMKPIPILSATFNNDGSQSVEDIEVEIDHVNDTLSTTTTEANVESSNETSVHKEDPGLSKNTDYLIIPVNAVNPSVNVPTNNKNSLTPMTGMDNTYNQGSYPVNQNIPYSNDMNGQMMNQGYPQNNGPLRNTNLLNSMPPNNNYPNTANNYPNSYLNIPNNFQATNGPTNLYYQVNNPNQINNGYSAPNSPQFYHLVPIQNVPNGGMNQNNVVPYNSQPNNFIPVSNNNVRTYNQPNNFAPNNNQPNIFVPVNNVPNYNNFVPVNNMPNNYVPVNNFNPQTNNFNPISNGQNNLPNNYIPINNSNFVPLNNQPNNYIPVNNQPNNYIPVNSQPNNYIPVNNQPNNYIPVNSQPNNYVPVNNQPNNYIPVNNQPNNYISVNNQPNSYIPPNNYGQSNNYAPNNNNNFVPNNNYNNQPNEFRSSDNNANNVTPFNNNQNNFVSYNEPINSNVPVSSNVVVVPVQPVGILRTLKDDDDSKQDPEDKLKVE